MSGVNSVLILHPKSSILSDVTFDMTVTDGASSGYVVPVQSVELNEMDRLEIQYVEGSKIDGGRLVNSRGPLVVVKFDVRVADTTRAGMIQKANDLFQVVTDDKGGTLEFKPDGLGAGIGSMFFRYLKSKTPALKQMRSNRWDGPPNSGGIYHIVLTVELMTMPFATSDPDSPTQLVTSQTLDNTDDATRTNHVTISGSLIKGTAPALVRVTANPSGTGDAAVGRMIVARRTVGLDNFQAIYNTATFLAPTDVWSTVTDSSRSGGNYYRCTPDANGAAYGLRYTISNWEDHKGRAAVLIVARDNSTDEESIEAWAAWSIANTPLTSEIKYMAATDEWRILTLAEFDIPETEMSDVEDLDLYIDVYVRRTAGDGTFDVDFLGLLYTDESIVDGSTPVGEGADSGDDVLIENLTGEEIGHVIDHTSSKLQYILNLVGTPGLLTLLPGQDNRLDVLWERYGGPAFFSDDFADYDDYWEKISSMEAGETWVFEEGTDTGAKTDYVPEGDQCFGGETEAATGHRLIAYRDGSWDLSGISDYALICCSVFSDDVYPVIEIRFHTTVDTDYFWDEDTGSSINNAYSEFALRKGYFHSVGSPDWSSITRIEIRISTSTYVGTVRFDDLRASNMADVDDPDLMYDETGGNWLLPVENGYEAWHIYELDSTEKFLGRLPLHGIGGTGVSYGAAVVAQDYGSDVRLSAKVKMRSSGAAASMAYAGLFFRCTEYSPGETGYSFTLHPSDDTVVLQEHTSGVGITTLDSASFTNEFGSEYYLGVIVQSTSIKCFASIVRTDLWDDDNLLIEVTDSTHTSGRAGVISAECHSRFGDVELESVADLHVPGDQIVLNVWSLFQTIYPFAE